MEPVKQNFTASLDESAHGFLEKKRDIDRHCENMSKAGALMGEPELQAAANSRGASAKVRVQSNNNYVAALGKYGVVNYVTKAKNYSLRTDGTVDEHSPELHPEYSALKFVDGATDDDECLVATPTANSR